MNRFSRCYVFYSAVLVWASSQAMESHAAPSGEGEGETSSNNTILLGGLFSVQDNEGGVCDSSSVSPGPFANVEAMIFAVNDINNRSDILPNVTLKYEILNTCGLSKIALEEAVELMDIHLSNNKSSVGISGIVGPALSDVSISVAGLLRVFQIPQISHSSTAAILSDKQMFDYFFRTIPPDSFQAEAMADMILHFNWTYIIGIHTDDSYGRGGIAALRKELSRRNDSGIVCVLSEDGVTGVPLNAGETHYRNLVNYINRSWISNASVAVLFGQRLIAENLFEFMLEHNITLDHLTWIASDAWATRVNKSHQHLVQGMLGLVPQVLHVRNFNKHFQSLRPSNDSTNPWLNEYWESRFKCALQGTENRCSSSLQLNLTDNPVGNGVAYVVEAVHTFAHSIHNLLGEMCPNSSGLLCPEVTVERFHGRALNGTLIRDYIYKVVVPALSEDLEDITFDRKAGDQPGFYDIKNLGRNGHQTVGTWDTKNKLQFTGDIEWRNGIVGVPTSICSKPCEAGEAPQLVEGESDCCHTCELCIGDNTIGTGERCEECILGTSPSKNNSMCMLNPVTYLRWSSPWAIVILIGTTLGLAATAFVAAVFIIFNKQKIIKATSRELSAILLTGIALCYIIPFFFIAEPSPATCAIRRFSIGFCFSLCFSPLLMKTNRIYRVFHTAPQTPRFAGSWNQVVFTCGLVSVQIFIAALWLGIERPSVKFVNSTTITEKICGESPYIGLPVSLIYSLLILVLATFYAFLAREIPANFNETKFIAITLYSICIVWLGFFPTYFATIKLGTVYQTSTLVFAVLLSASTTLACLFFPKVILLFIKLAKEKKSEDEKTTTTTTDLGLSDVGNSYSLGLDRSASNYTL